LVLATVPCIKVEGPSPTNVDDNTFRIQRAINDASSGHEPLGFGGCVSIGDGDWRVRTVEVKSNITLRIEARSRLVNVVNVTELAVVLIDNAQHVTIEGGGMIYGDAENAWSYYSEKDGRFSPYGVDGSKQRVHLLLVRNSEDIVVRDISLHNSTDWTFRMDASRDIWVENVDIYGDSRFPNNDGFDPESCTNVTLLNSRIDVADDGICPKASAGSGPLQGFVVRNTTVRSHSHAIKFGSNTDTNMSDILFDNITIWDSNGGMSIQQRSQGSIINVTFSNVKVETRYEAPRWWGNGEWLSISNTPRDNGFAIGEIRGLQFINISGRSENGGLLSGLSNGAYNIEFKNVHIRIETWGNYSTGPLPCSQNPKVCTNEAHPLCVPQTATPGTEISCLGSHDYRPTPPGNCSYYCRSKAVADGIYMENVHGVSFEDVSFTYESPRKEWFGECLRLDEHSTNISGADDIKCINGPPVGVSNAIAVVV
jgi:hypothetical protein